MGELWSGEELIGIEGRVGVRKRTIAEWWAGRHSPVVDASRSGRSLISLTPVAGDQIATTTTSWNFSSSTQVTHPVSIYFASVPLQAGKTVASVTLPTVSATVGNGITAMHIFAMAIGSGTPTGG